MSYCRQGHLLPFPNNRRTLDPRKRNITRTTLWWRWALNVKLVIQTNSQKVIKEMYPNETAEHHRDHRCRNKEVNKFCYDPISKYRGNFCGCITRHHPVWAGSRSWVSRHLSLHLSIRGDEVRVRSCLIFRYRIWPKKQCILEKHSNLLQKYNSCRLLLPITHKYLSSQETRKHRHIFARVAAFWQRVFSNLTKFECSPRRGGISYT